MKSPGFLTAALLAVTFTQTALAQETAIRGRVTDSTTVSPLSGVNVSYGKSATLSLADGRFVLTGVVPGTDTLKIRMLGYAPISRVVTVTSGQTVNLDFTLVAQAVSLSEIVVTGYGQQSAGNITGAVTAVSSEEFNTGRIISPAQLIATKVPGVQVVDNNEPGGGLTLRIRGATSVNASSEPLYVIDGMPVGGGAGGGLAPVGKDGLNFLNPEDIQSITVLRDASAAAIYGANAANGVVIITTKSRTGQAGRLGTYVEYTGNLSSSSVDRLPSMLNAQQFRDAVAEHAPQNLAQLGTANTNWFDQTTGTAFGQEHNFSLTSTQEKSFLRLSLGYLNQDGVVDGTTAERVSLTANYQQLLFKDRLNIRANIKGSQTDDRITPGGVLSNSAQFGPTQPIFDENSTTGYYEWPNNALQSADNPAAILGFASDHAKTYRSLGNVRAAYSMPFLPALTANVNMGYDYSSVDRSTFTPRVLHSQTKSGTNGTDYRTNPSETNTVLETYLNYAAPASIVPGNLDAAVGYSYSHSNAEFPWYQGTGLSTDVLEGNGVTSATTQQNGMDVQEAKLISFFGRVNYNINDTYLLSFSVRRDGSSRFGADNAWGTFPSVSLGWRLSEYDMFKGFLGLSDLKLRGSWAKTGNQAFANYQQYSSYRFGDNQSSVQFGDQFIPTIRPSAVDPNIKWESTTAYNFGIDFGFSNQRWSGSLDWYTKDTDDLIFTIPVAAGTNLSNFVTTNIGTMKNTGIELALNADILQARGGGLGWTASFTAAHNNNELTSIAGSVDEILVGGIAGGVGSTIQVLKPGYPVNSFFTYEHKLVDGKPVYEDVNGDQVINDKDLYVDQNGDGNINVDDRRPLFDPAPDWTFGLSNYLNYGRFGLNFTLRAYTGNYVYNNVASNLGTYKELTRASPYNLQSSVLETNFAEPQYLSDWYVEDASFFRMDNITLDYRFDMAGKPWRVFGTLQNAFTITGYSGVDPTSGLNGIDNNIYPRARTFTAGLSLRF
ncbi:MAG TPA: SusC/RagA family TonB-linked outer membrane protein [Gemmatimonadales bacterium]|nr:SusC/RagA family TonB-linked outer membrane protein [Gemmatimonadales bacterium]